MCEIKKDMSFRALPCLATSASQQSIQGKAHYKNPHLLGPFGDHCLSLAHRELEKPIAKQRQGDKASSLRRTLSLNPLTDRLQVQRLI